MCLSTESESAPIIKSHIFGESANAQGAPGAEVERRVVVFVFERHVGATGEKLPHGGDTTRRVRANGFHQWRLRASAIWLRSFMAPFSLIYNDTIAPGYVLCRLLKWIRRVH